MGDPVAANDRKHFNIEPVGPGLYAAIHLEGGWGIGNAGIVDLGDKTLVFDTGMTAAAGAELRQAAERLTGKPVSLVVNSHYHNDHVWGNQAFAPETTFIASEATRQLLLSAGQAEVDHYRATAPGTFEALRARHAAERDPGRRRQIAVGLSYYEALAASLPELEVRLPTVTFFRRLDIHGHDGSVQLLAYADGHTGNDTILYVPAAGVVFAADLLFVNCHPYLADGDPHNLLTILDQLGQLGAAVYVPGHGPVGGPADLTALRSYIRACATLAAAMDTADQIDRTQIPPAYAGWELSSFFADNLRFLWRRARSSADA